MPTSETTSTRPYEIWTDSWPRAYFHIYSNICTRPVSVSWKYRRILPHIIVRFKSPMLYSSTQGTSRLRSEAQVILRHRTLWKSGIHRPWYIRSGAAYGISNVPILFLCFFYANPCAHIWAHINLKRTWCLSRESRTETERWNHCTRNLFRALCIRLTM